MLFGSDFQGLPMKQRRKRLREVVYMTGRIFLSAMHKAQASRIFKGAGFAIAFPDTTIQVPHPTQWAECSLWLPTR